jgi:hypothetical protein
MHYIDCDSYHYDRHPQQKTHAEIADAEREEIHFLPKSASILVTSFAPKKYEPTQPTITPTINIIISQHTPSPAAVNFISQVGSATN